MTNGSLMKVESIAECSNGHSAILFTCIKRNWYRKTIFGLFENNRFRKVLLNDNDKHLFFLSVLIKDIAIAECCLDAFIQRYMYFEYIYHCKLQKLFFII